MDYSQFAPADSRMARLNSLYAHGAPPHALCLIGSNASVTGRLAGHFAASLLCQSRQDRPCGLCNACKRVSADTHANLLRLAIPPKERTIKIDALRSLLDALSLHPQESGPRVIIITDVQAMTVQAQNALLKSLEEPVAADFFILTAAVEQAVLPTIRSRCELHRIGHIMNDLIEAQPSVDTEAAGEAHGLAERTFFAVRSAADIPTASSELRAQKDQQDELLDLLEKHALCCLADGAPSPGQACSPWQKADAIALRRVLSATLEARKYLGSNVSWQAVADRLLFTITKEIHQCPLS